MMPLPREILSDACLSYRSGRLHSEEVNLEEVAKRFGSPTFVYSKASIARAYAAIRDALSFAPHMIAYAVKANGNLAVLRHLAEMGSGADIVSEGELRRALRAGIPAENIVFSGVGKKRAEIAAALDSGVRAIHVESVGELDAVEEIARGRGVRAPVALRVNPNVDAETHPYIATGLHHTKFGLELEVARPLLPRIVSSSALDLVAVACHIGSQVSSSAALTEAVDILSRFAEECVAAGATLHSIDVGGGWPMNYGNEAKPFPPPAAFGDAIRAGLGDRVSFKVVTEPGRALVGPAGVLLTEVLYVKDQGEKRFVIVDAAMTDLIRPALYCAHHEIISLREAESDARWAPVDVVGPVCESGDFLAQDRLMPPVEPGDLLAVCGAGAYGREMASTYNGRPLAAEAMVDGDALITARERAPIESLWAHEPSQSNEPL